MNVSPFSNIIKVRRVFIDGDAVFLNETVIGELAETDNNGNIGDSKRIFIYLFIHFEPIEQRFMKIEDHLKSLRPILDAVLCRGVPELFYLARLSLMYKNFL